MKFLRLPSDASHGRRGVATVLHLPAREICFAVAICITPSRLGAYIIPQNQACGRDNSVESSFYRTARARRPIRALSLPDAPCERIDIRKLTENLTNNLREQEPQASRPSGWAVVPLVQELLGLGYRW